MSELPEKDTPEHALFVAALNIAIGAPLRGGTNTHSAQVPWTSIGALRTALEGVGIDWKATKKEQDSAWAERERLA